jgi:RecJ-like exonuclease
VTEAQKRAARKRYHREAEALCPTCDGKGRILTRNTCTRARAGGNASYLKSLQPGSLTMSERGKKGGRPRSPTRADLAPMGKERR